MCDLANGFKLCTCSGDGPFHWVLQTRDHSLPAQSKRGGWCSGRPGTEEHAASLKAAQGPVR